MLYVFQYAITWLNIFIYVLSWLNWRPHKMPNIKMSFFKKGITVVPENLKKASHSPE